MATDYPTHSALILPKQSHVYYHDCGQNLFNFLPDKLMSKMSKMPKLIKRELDIEDYEETYWTDNKVILGYINNEVKCFKIFVANRIQTIKENSNIKQWKYISSKENPADDGSRGLDATKVNKVTRWFNGPAFLWKPESEWTISAEFQPPNEDDPEVRKEVTVNVIGIEKQYIGHARRKNILLG